MKNILGVNEYQQLVLRTENKDQSKIEERLLDPLTLTLLGFYLERLVFVTKKLDDLKKHIFYGKEIPPVTMGMLKLIEMESEKIQWAQGEVINDRVKRIIHSVLGIATEGGELAQMTLDDVFVPHPERPSFDLILLNKELGDVAWYTAQGSDANGYELSICFGENIAKLQKRYPANFDEKLAQNHDGQ